MVIIGLDLSKQMCDDSCINADIVDHRQTQISNYMEIIMTARIANEDTVEKLNSIVALKQVYDIPEILAMVPIGRSKLYDEINAKKLHATKIGRRTLFLLKDVLAWLEGTK